MLTLDTLREGFKVFNWWNQPVKESVLDPMITTVELSLLAFEPVGTKLGVEPHDLTFHPPGLLQGGYRWFWSQKQTDLKILGETIRKCVSQYDSTTSKEIQTIYRVATRGLENLQKTYPNTTTSDAAITWIAHFNNREINGDIHISHILEKTKGTWANFYLSEIAANLEIAEEQEKLKDTNIEAKKKFYFALRKIDDLLQAKKTDFERILALENVS